MPMQFPPPKLMTDKCRSYPPMKTDLLAFYQQSAGSGLSLVTDLWIPLDIF